MTDTSESRRSAQHGQLLIGLGTIALAGLYLYQAQEFDIGTWWHPGPAMFPSVIGAALIATGCLISVNSLRGQADVEPEAGGNARLGKLIAVLAAFVAGLYALGFTVSALVAVYLMVHVLGSTLRVPGRLAYTAALVLTTEFVFTQLFGVQFPGGLIGLVM